MSDLDHAQMLLCLAQKDLQAAERMSTDAAFAEEIFGFHAQQAAEKALKAWLSLRGVDYPRTHDLSLLLAQLRHEGETVPEEFATVVDLSDFAVQFRYEMLDDTGDTERRQALVPVQQLVAHVESLVAGAGEPS